MANSSYHILAGLFIGSNYMVSGKTLLDKSYFISILKISLPRTVNISKDKLNLKCLRIDEKSREKLVMKVYGSWLVDCSQMPSAS